MILFEKILSDPILLKDIKKCGTMKIRAQERENYRNL